MLLGYVLPWHQVKEKGKQTNKKKSRILDKQIKNAAMNAAIKANTTLYYNNMTKNISEKLLWILV